MKQKIRKLIQQKKIEVGLTQEQLQHFLGTPAAKSRGTRKYPDPLIWKYGDVEFHWTPLNKKLWLVIEVTGPNDHEILLK